MMNEQKPLMVLSVRQPWAWLIVHGWKNIENRTWYTTVRGRILIHAAKGMTRTEWYTCANFVNRFAPSVVPCIPDPEVIERGGIVGAVTILDCVRQHRSEWFEGPFGFVLDDAEVVPFVPCKGALGFFQAPPEARAL